MGRKRRSPRRHTVHTKHPRYNVNRYGRGVEGHSGEKLRKRIQKSALSGYDSKYYEKVQNPLFPDRSFIHVKPYLSGRRTISYQWEKIIADKTLWKDLLRSKGFKKVASSPDGKSDIIYRNPQDMYIIVQREHDVDFPEKGGVDLGYVRFDAHPDLHERLCTLVNDFRGMGKVPEFDIDYIAQREPRVRRGILFWSKDGETQPSATDFKPVSLQMEDLQKQKNRIKSSSKNDAEKRFYTNMINAKIKALKDVRN
ncbi:MAG: hypothetical protein ACTSPB_01420 [Candidatus Thorarchaeota archaeon]